MFSPSRVGVSHQFFSGLHLLGDGVDSLDVDVGITSDLQLKASVAIRAMFTDVGGHFLGRTLGNGAIEDKIVSIAPTKEFANRLP